MKKSKRIIITILALIGLALSIELCVVYYNANFVIDANPSICVINSSLDCDSVARTAYSQFFGIPLSYWGVFLYCFFLFMIFVDKIQNIRFLGFLKVFKNPSSYIFCVSLFSFIMSMVLFFISWFKIDSFCIFCLMTYFVDFFIAITAKNREVIENGESDKPKRLSVIDEYKISFSDFIEAVKVKKYLIAFVIVLLAAICFLIYTSLTNIFSPQVQLQKELKNSFKQYTGEIEGTRIGSKDAKLVIHEFMDFNCGGCFVVNLYIHRILDEFDDVAVIQHNLPLDGMCNHNVPKGKGHTSSCIKSYYALAAAKQNKYWQMGSILFNNDVKTEKDILEKARLIDIDIRKLKADAHSDDVKKEVEASIKEGDLREINGTPTLFIGLKKLFGIGSYPEFKEIVIEQGGREKPNHG